jgi:molybdopterin-guanine dinucleotide biosynthesis protein A
MIVGVVLAGGRALRFGADKALAELGGRSLLDASLAVLERSCAQIAVNARADSPVAGATRARGLACLPDPSGAPRGPLAGVLAGLTWAQDIGAELLASAPCDTPFLPAELVDRLAAALTAESGAAFARAPEGVHPLCAVWRVRALETLTKALAGGDHPPVREALRRLGAVAVDFDDDDAFHNINTQGDLAAAIRAAAGSKD